MNTPPRPHFALTAQFLGPVFSLDAKLTKRAQNLIFARNGVGKSFLSRAFRYLDMHGQGLEISDAARNLVSDESPDRKGAFSFSRGTEVMGSLQIDAVRDKTTVKVSDTIFHVFSDEFVQKELRERRYVIDGEIKNQISVDSENIKLEDAKAALEKARGEDNRASKKLLEKFGEEKLSELNVKAAIHKQLKEYKELGIETQVMRLTKKPDSPLPSFGEILNDLDSLKALPSDPAYPEEISLISQYNIDTAALVTCLKKITSPASMSEKIRQRIALHNDFYKTGTRIVQDEERETCPFCEQGILASDPKSIIDSYIAYFADEEEKHKSELRGFFALLQRMEEEVAQVEGQIARQKSRFDLLKRFVPSMKDREFDDCDKKIEKVRETISAYKDVIQQKARNLSLKSVLPSDDLVEAIAATNGIIESNNSISNNLKYAVSRSDQERKSLQRRACSVFSQEFAIRYWDEIKNIRSLRGVVRDKASDLATLESASPSTDAKVRVAQTFELLLREFFAGKYVFDKEDFILKRGDKEMTRGPHRTLSDGEKTAIAFCYFVACVHRKVKANSDYHKLFLVFDDPVTSMSYDFVFTIAHTLKHMSISRQGEVSINPSLIDGNNYVRPELLILTHSSYFFNVSLTNRAVDTGAAFALHAESNGHSLTALTQYVAPFHQQLKEVYEIANGKNPDHGTGNAIRSVLEAVGRFCRPDKCKNLAEFVAFLASEEDISLKSILINSLSHGTYYDEVPPPDDLRLAAEETVRVVDKYAVGQLEIIRS